MGGRVEDGQQDGVAEEGVPQVESAQVRSGRHRALPVSAVELSRHLGDPEGAVASSRTAGPGVFAGVEVDQPSIVPPGTVTHLVPHLTAQHGALAFKSCNGVWLLQPLLVAAN